MNLVHRLISNNLRCSRNKLGGEINGWWWLYYNVMGRFRHIFLQWYWVRAGKCCRICFIISSSSGRRQAQNGQDHKSIAGQPAQHTGDHVERWHGGNYIMCQCWKYNQFWNILRYKITALNHNMAKKRNNSSFNIAFSFEMQFLIFGSSNNVITAPDGLDLTWPLGCSSSAALSFASFSFGKLSSQWSLLSLKTHLVSF